MNFERGNESNYEQKSRNHVSGYGSFVVALDGDNEWS